LCISTSAFAQSPKKVPGRVMDAQGALLIGGEVTLDEPMRITL